MGAADSWTSDHDVARAEGTDATRPGADSTGSSDVEVARPWVAVGGWRRAVVGIVTGLVAGLTISRWVDRD
ncbi:MAG: hypothetical protein WDZ26_03505 [Nitriliruptoraceae bacterium]